MSDFNEYKISILENNKRNYDLIQEVSGELKDHVKDYMLFKGKLIGMIAVASLFASGISALAVALITAPTPK